MNVMWGRSVARRWRHVIESPAAPIALAVLLGLGLLLYGLSHLVRHQVMEERFYLEALERQTVYDRVYEEVLADPALAATVDPLLGNVPIDRAFVVSTLRLVLPPEQIRRGTEVAATEWVRYLEGRRGIWQPRIDLGDTRGNVMPIVSDQIASRLAITPGQEVETVDDFIREVEVRLFDLIRGRAPGVIPAIQPRDPEEADALASLILSRARAPVPEERHRQVSAALLTGDVHEAFALAAPVYLRDTLADAGVSWQEQLIGGRIWDAVHSFERLAEQSSGTVAERLHPIRNVTFVLGEPLWLVSTLLIAGSLHGLLWLLLRQGRSKRRWLGVTLLATGATGTALLLLALAILDAYIGRLVAGLPATFPPSVAGVFLDVRSDLLASLRAAAAPGLLALSVLGVILLASRWVMDRAHLPVRALGVRRWRSAIAALTVLAAVTALGFVEIGRAVVDRDAPLMRCNGLRELCDRRVDEVVFAGTHNSMSAASLGWVFPHHDRGLYSQLTAGYRALLIDTHYWGAEFALHRMDGEFPQEHQAALIDILERADPPREGVFLCHGVCGIGATPLEEALSVIAGFMRRNPHEVVILSLEDYISPEDTVRAFQDSGLMPLVYQPDEQLLEQGQWPTLRELIQRDERVIVLADHRGGDPEWYLPFARYMQDTPFRFHHPGDFTCGPNRGSPQAGMLMINHWIATLPPDRSQAVVVNTRQMLLDRVEQCREVRGMEPSIIAVDFYSIGDTIRVVEELNLAPR